MSTVQEEIYSKGKKTKGQIGGKTGRSHLVPVQEDVIPDPGFDCKGIVPDHSGNGVGSASGAIDNEPAPDRFCRDDLSSHPRSRPRSSHKHFGYRYGMVRTFIRCRLSPGRLTSARDQVFERRGSGDHDVVNGRRRKVPAELGESQEGKQERNVGGAGFVSKHRPGGQPFELDSNDVMSRNDERQCN